MTAIREDSLREIKSRVNLGTVVARIVELKGARDDLRGLCPFHNEKTPSFHVHPDRGFFKCFGCGKGGDAIDFVRESEHLDFVQAVEALGTRFNIPVFYESGERAADGSAPAPFQRPPPRIETRAPSQTWLRLQPTLRRGTISELAQVAALRRIPALAGLELATRAGHLWFADVWDDGFEWPSWIITDFTRRNAQARRMDGQPWSGIGDKKAKTIQGCEANWPVGIPNTPKGIALVEGGPDLLAAWHFIWHTGRTRDCSPVAMLGASQSIHPDALPLFAGKRIWIFPHRDENRAGEIAAAKWKADLLEAGAADIVLWDFSKDRVKDLNELVAIETAMEDCDAN